MSGFWLARNNQTEIVSRRPMAQRVMFGLFAGLIFWFAFSVVPRLLPLVIDPVAWGAVAFVLLVFMFLISCFLHGTHSREFRLDIQQRRYSLKQGVLFLTWIRQGEVNKGEISVGRTKSGQYAVLFKAQRQRYGLPLEFCRTETEARLLACEIADKLGLEMRSISSSKAAN